MLRLSMFMSRAMVLIGAGALLLGACGGDDSSPSRNNSFQIEACLPNQQIKDQMIARLTANLAAANVLADESLARNEEMGIALNRASEKWQEIVEFYNSPDATETEERAAESERLNAEYETLRLAAVAATERALESEEAVNFTVPNLEAALAELQDRPVCEPREDAAPGASLPADDVTTTLAGQAPGETTPSVDDSSTSSTISGMTSTTTEVSPVAPTTSVGDGGSPVNDSPTSTAMPVSAVAIESCGSPAPEEGTELQAPVGGTITVTVPHCAVLGDNAAISYGIPVPVTGTVSALRTSTKIVLTSDETASVLMFLAHQDGSTYEQSQRTWVSVTFTDLDPCADKQPDASWDPARDDGTFMTTSTCNASTAIWAQIDRIDGPRTENVFRGELISGSPYSDLIQAFGKGTYRVRNTHMAGGKWSLVGRTRVTEIVWDPSSSPSSSAPATGQVSLPGIVEVPLPAFTPAVSERVENPLVVDPRVPVIALPVDALVMTCDAQCTERAVSQAGASGGSAEIAVGDGEWETLSDASLITVPTKPTNVRIRVTPESGDPVVMSVILTRDSTDEVLTAEQAPATSAGQTPDVTGSGGSSFPWWIIVLLLIILALVREVLRRRRRNADTPEDSTTA